MPRTEDTATSILRSLVAKSPWARDYDDDWCHFCLAEPSYPDWMGHDEDCPWLVASEWLKAQDAEN